MAETKIEKVSYKGWPNCYKVSDGEIEFIATTDIGPRIISCGFAGERNLFHVVEETAGKTGGDEWHLYGGHRLWHSPEDKFRTYNPDNSPIKVEQLPEGLRLTQPVEERTGIQKEIEIRLVPSERRVHLIHRLKNTNVWAVEFSPWALTVMAPGGFSVVPLPTSHHEDNLLPNRSLTFWPYTDLRDDRLLLGTDYVLLRQDK